MDYQDALERYVGHRVAVTTYGSIRIWGTVIAVHEDHVRLGNTSVTNEHEDQSWYGQMQHGDPDNDHGPRNAETVVQFHQIVAISCQDDIRDPSPESSGKKSRAEAAGAADPDEFDEYLPAGSSNSAVAAVAPAVPSPPVTDPGVLSESVLQELTIDRVRIELGGDLTALAEKGQAEIVRRISLVRAQVARELGIVVPLVRLTDDLLLPAGAYRILIEEVAVAVGEVVPDRLLAIDGGQVTRPILGTPTLEPVYGMPACWITKVQREQAEMNGYLVCDASAALTVHLQKMLQQHSADLFLLDDCRAALLRVAATFPVAVAEAEGRVALPKLHRVLQCLLAEGVSIRPLAKILQAVALAACHTDEVDELVVAARRAVGPHILESLRREDGQIHAIALDEALAELWQSSIADADAVDILGTGLAEILAQLADEVRGFRIPLVLVVPAPIRASIWQSLQTRFAHARVLAKTELLEPFEVVTDRTISAQEVLDIGNATLQQQGAKRESLIAAHSLSDPRDVLPQTETGHPAAEPTTPPRQPR